ncbi:MAG: hypothetical protein JNM27_03070 [Leptospirales bacterium]|nr:hypothetical protein [Leptospirales bacterium]
MQPNLQDVLNAGIGLIRASEEAVGQAVANAQKTFEDLKNKGASDFSDSAIKAREALASALRVTGAQG